MTEKPHDWNIVLPGYWNRAILTPKGIARRLFLLREEESAFQIAVPVDGLSPSRVTYADLSVEVARDSLKVLLEKPDFETLARGLVVAARALKDLAETPVHAAGFNLRYQIEVPDSELARVTQSPIDSLSDLGLKFTSWGLLRRIEFQKGSVNLTSNIDDNDNHQLVLNFHRDAASPEKHDTLIEWMTMDLDLVKKQTSDILRAISKQEN